MENFSQIMMPNKSFLLSETENKTLNVSFHTTSDE